MTLTNLKTSRTAIANQIGQLEKKRHQDNSETIRNWLRAQNPASCRVCHPSCDMNFADPHEKSESMCIKPMTQRNLKHLAPSVRALTLLLWLRSTCKLEKLWGHSAVAPVGVAASYSIQIMNVYECNGTNIFMRWNVPFKEAKPSWMVHFIFYQMKILVPLHEWENIICFIQLVQRFKFVNKFKRKSIEKLF